MNGEEREAAMHKAIQDTAPEGALVQDWVVVAEYVDESGDMVLGRMGNNTLTVWKRRGMLLDAAESDDYENYDAEEE